MEKVIRFLASPMIEKVFSYANFNNIELAQFLTKCFAWKKITWRWGQLPLGQTENEKYYRSAYVI